MDSQDMFADVDVADTQVSQQSKKRKRAECRVRQINVQWSTETVMSLIVEVQKLEPLYNVLHEHYKDRELRNRNWIAVGAGIGVDGEQCKLKWNSLRTSLAKIRIFLANERRHSFNQ